MTLESSGQSRWTRCAASDLGPRSPRARSRSTGKAPCRARDSRPSCADSASSTCSIAPGLASSACCTPSSPSSEIAAQGADPDRAPEASLRLVGEGDHLLQRLLPRHRTGEIGDRVGEDAARPDLMEAAGQAKQRAVHRGGRGVVGHQRRGPGVERFERGHGSGQLDRRLVERRLHPAAQRQARREGIVPCGVGGRSPRARESAGTAWALTRPGSNSLPSSWMTSSPGWTSRSTPRSTIRPPSMRRSPRSTHAGSSSTSVPPLRTAPTRALLLIVLSMRARTLAEVVTPPHRNPPGSAKRARAREEPR